MQKHRLIQLTVLLLVLILHSVTTSNIAFADGPRPPSQKGRVKVPLVFADSS